MMDNTIKVRFGETLKLAITLDNSFTNLSSLKFFVGDAGPQRPLQTATATVTGTTATINIPKVKVPVGKHYYQMTAVFADGTIEKYPDGSGAKNELPVFLVGDALDVVETR